MNAGTLLVTIGSLLLVSCAGPSGEAPEDGPSASSTGQSAPADPTTVRGEVPSELLNDIIADATGRAGVEPEQLRVVVAEAVTWSDGSLGCPEPGMMYTQALVPGYRVVLEAGGEELHFHAAESGDFRFCEDPQPPLDDGTVDR